MVFRFIYICTLSLLLFSCVGTDQRVVVKNQDDFSRTEVVSVDVSSLKQRLLLDESYHVLDSDGHLLPSQLTYDGKLIFQSSVEANSSSSYTIKVRKLRNYTPQVFGRYFPERYGDFAWENDKLGFRFYGAPLKAIQSPTNGLDVWYKRTNALVLEKWYENDISKTASYHVDHGEGCDPYGVGPSLGAGAMAPYIEGKLVRNENFDSYEILDAGPLRLTAKLTYPSMTINGTSVIDVRTVSLDAGSHYTRITQDYGTSEFRVAAGIVKRLGCDSILVSSDQQSLIYQEPMSEDNGQIYLGLIFAEGFTDSLLDSYPIGKNTFSHVLVLRNYLGKPVSYYTGFGWSKSDFTSLESFQSYTDDFSRGLTSPLLVELK